MDRRFGVGGIKPQFGAPNPAFFRHRAGKARDFAGFDVQRGEARENSVAFEV